MITDPTSPLFWILIIGIIAGAIAIIARPFSTYVKFVYPNAKFEAMGNPFIGEKELESIAESKNIISFKETINTLKDYNLEGEDTYKIQKALDENFLNTITMMKADSSKKLNPFYDAYLEKQDIYLIKNELKKILKGTPSIVDINRAILPKTQEFLEQLKDVEKDKLPELLIDYGFTKEIIENIQSENIDLLELDTQFDKHIMTNLHQTRVPYQCAPAKDKLIKTMTDIRNIKNILRAKQLGYDLDLCKKLFVGEGAEIPRWKFDELSEQDDVPQVISGLEGTSYYNNLKDSIEKYNSEKSVQTLEIALDKQYLNLVRDISMKNYATMGPTIRFLVSKEFEIKNLKIIAKGISENLPADRITRLLVTEGAI